MAYTRGMEWRITGLLILFPLLAAAVPEAPPAEAKTFRITIEDTDNLVCGAIRAGGKWVDDYNRLDESVMRVEIVPDTPWAPQEPFREFRNRIRVHYETEARRRKRHEEGWEEAGYTFIDTENGRMPLLQEELELAERARELELERRETLHRQPPPPGKNPESAAEIPENTAAPGFLQLWGGQIAAGASGIVLAGLALWLLVFRNP
jgi:hypothetical protein